MTSITPTSRRKWLRFGTRTLLVLMILVSIPLAWKVNRVRSQRRIVKAIENAGGNVEYDYEVESARQNPQKPIPPGPLWLHNLLGKDFFSDVATVTLPDRFVSNDEILSVVSELPGLREVIAFNVSDNGLGHLARVPSITRLTIGGSFTEAGLAQLATLTKLVWLVLSSHPKLTDKDMVKTLVAFKRLKYLVIETLSEEDFQRLRESLPSDIAMLHPVED